MLKFIDENGYSFLLNPEHILYGLNHKVCLTSGDEFSFDERSWKTVVTVCKKFKAFITFYSRSDKTEVLINRFYLESVFRKEDGLNTYHVRIVYGNSIHGISLDDSEYHSLTEALTNYRKPVRK